MQIDIHIPYNWPDTILINHLDKAGIIIALAVLRDKTMNNKETKNLEKNTRKTLANHDLGGPSSDRSTWSYVKLPGCWACTNPRLCKWVRFTD